jgi:GR25 family glycosyltransferase involved in LPS biosynthesis
MQVKVINLDRAPARMQRFRSDNPGLAFERVTATDGSDLARDGLIRDGIIAPENPYSTGALGNALSHVALWRHCAHGTEAFHIAEDDAVLHPDFTARAATLLEELPAWDVVFWGWNFDWPVRLHLTPAIRSVVLRFDQADMRGRVDAFRAGETPSRLVALESCAGTCCYAVSPRGAARLLARCLPIGDRCAPSASRRGRPWPNTGLDVEMSRHHSQMASYACLPPLALTRNDHATSTVQSSRFRSAAPRRRAGRG